MELELQQRNSYTELNQKVAKLTKELSKKERENSKHAQAILEVILFISSSTSLFKLAKAVTTNQYQ